MPVAIKLGCANCPMMTTPGSQFILAWTVANAYPNATVTYTTLAIAAGSGWTGTVSPSTPFSLSPGESQVLTLAASAPATSGAYFVPVSLEAVLS